MNSNKTPAERVCLHDYGKPLFFYLAKLLHTQAQHFLFFKKRTRRLKPAVFPLTKKLKEILNLLAQKSRATNHEIKTLLRVSNATATRYMDELEKQGKVRRVGTRRGCFCDLVK